jgi:hypothetical protein
MLRRVALVRTDVAEGSIAFIIWVTILGELRTLAVTSNRSTLRRNTLRNVGSYTPKDSILYSHRRENLKSYTVVSVISQQNNENSTQFN